MYKKISDYLGRELDYPVSENFDFLNKMGIAYHLNFRKLNEAYLLPNVSFDDAGIPRFDYSIVPAPNNENGLVYNITYICWYALGCLQEYLEDNSEIAKQDFLKQAEWLFKNNNILDGVLSWQIRFPYQVYGQCLAVPRVSSMDQGLAISILIRAYLLTGEKKYLDAAKKAFPYYNLTINEGGFKHKLKDGSSFYEMYPSNNPSLILDGHIFSLLGLYDLYKVTSDSRVKEFFDNGLRAVSNNIEFWNFRNIWSWFGRFYLSSSMYHKINICLVRILFKISHDSKLGELSGKWGAVYSRRFLEIYLKVELFIASRYFFITKKRIDGLFRKKII